MNLRITNLFKSSERAAASPIIDRDEASALRAAVSSLSSELDTCRIELASVSAAKQSMDNLWEEREHKIEELRAQVESELAARKDLENTFRAHLLSDIEETRKHTADLDRDIFRIYETNWWKLKLVFSSFWLRSRPSKISIESQKTRH